MLAISAKRESIIIESVDSISRYEPDALLTQYITNARISRARCTITHFKHDHRVLRLISNRISVLKKYIYKKLKNNIAI